MEIVLLLQKNFYKWFSFFNNKLSIFSQSDENLYYSLLITWQWFSQEFFLGAKFCARGFPDRFFFCCSLRSQKNLTSKILVYLLKKAGNFFTFKNDLRLDILKKFECVVSRFEYFFRK